MSRLSKKTVVFSLIILLLGIVAYVFYLQAKGYSRILERQTSPDGRVTCTVYDGVNFAFYPGTEGFTIKYSQYSRGAEIYGNAYFDGIWWSPDSRYLVIQWLQNDEIHLSMMDYKNNKMIVLDNYLNIPISYNTTFIDMFTNVDTWPDLHYRFVQWSKYGNFMLVNYNFVDTVGIEHLGYFWYDCDNGIVSGVMELPVNTLSSIEERN